MSNVILNMLALNVPLSQWQVFERTARATTPWHGGKNTDKVAQAIYTQLSHPMTVQLLAREFENLSSDLRIRLRTLCNAGNGSGNVRKGVQQLDALMAGKLLREEQHVQHFQTKTRDGWKSKAVKPAVAGATRKYQLVKN